MAERLIFETTAGNLSPSATFEQLIEYLRLCEEDARLINRLLRQRDQELTASGWMAFANNFSAARRIVEKLAKGKRKVSVGYGKPN